MFPTIFPILLAFFIPVVLIICYFEGYMLDHFEPILPLVSDTANYVPEAAIFSLMINMIGFLFIVVAFIRYLQLRAILNSDIYPQLMSTTGNDRDIEKAHIQKLNVWSLFLGLVVALSCCATGAFRFAESFIVHMVAASGIFTMTPVYVVVQTFLSSKFSDRVVTKKVVKFRYFSAALMLCCVILFVTSLPFSYFSFEFDYHDPMYRIFISEDQKGYKEHLVNAIGEWGFLLSISPFVLSLAFDFRRITFRGLQLDYHFVY